MIVLRGVPQQSESEPKCSKRNGASFPLAVELPALLPGFHTKYLVHFQFAKLITSTEPLGLPGTAILEHKESLKITHKKLGKHVVHSF
jgi:hypothetical protein